jgi:para-aminobenzoate synthetase component 1
MMSSPPPAEPLVEPFHWDGSLLELFRRVARGRHPFLLLSGTACSGRGRWTLMGSDPFDVWSAGDGEDPFPALQSLLAAHAILPAQRLPFAGGLVGYLGYECLQHVERVPVHASDLPAAWFGLYGSAVVVDGRMGKAWMVSTGLPEREPELRRRRARDNLARLRSWLAEPLPAPAGAEPLTGPLESSLDASAYQDAVQRILDHIRAGDIYQANLTQRFHMDAEVPDPVRLLGRLHGASPAPHAAYLDTGEWTILSSSPERFLRKTGLEVESRPIKGTASRGATPELDAAQRAGLEVSPKERAENLMIVDLVRNDLSRVCRPGTVHVPALSQVETYTTLHHLVSTVRGLLRERCSVAELLRAAFPPGSMTGAPKVRAMEILHELEPVSRGPYSGALGYLSFCGDLDLSVVIRTVLLGRGQARFHVGGGVVADSDPRAEYEESLLKAQALRRGLGIAGS